MPSTYTLISSNVLTSSAASVTFSAIPSTYTDLVVKLSARDDSAGQTVQLGIQFNSNTSSIYSNTIIRGSGSAVISERNSSTTSTRVFNINGDATTSNTFGSGEIYIPNYTGTTQKPLSGFGATENNATQAFIFGGAGLANLTSAITSITLFNNGGTSNFMTGSSFYLYGIKNS